MTVDVAGSEQSDTDAVRSVFPDPSILPWRLNAPTWKKSLIWLLVSMMLIFQHHFGLNSIRVYQCRPSIRRYRAFAANPLEASQLRRADVVTADQSSRGLSVHRTSGRKTACTWFRNAFSMKGISLQRIKTSRPDRPDSPIRKFSFEELTKVLLARHHPARSAAQQLHQLYRARWHSSRRKP